MTPIAPRQGRVFWQRVVAAAEVAGASHAAVARQFGVRVRTLRSWIYRLRRERRARPTVRVLPVEVAPSPVATTVLVQRGDVRLEFAVGTDPAYVAAVLAALRC